MAEYYIVDEMFEIETTADSLTSTPIDKFKQDIELCERKIDFLIQEMEKKYGVKIIAVDVRRANKPGDYYDYVNLKISVPEIIPHAELV